MNQLPWEESYFIGTVYDGLKEEVKDELMRIRNKPTTFNEWATLVIDIDDNQFARRQEKKRGSRRTEQPVYKPNQGKPRQPQQGRQPRQWGNQRQQHASGDQGDPMELDAMQKKKDKKEVECYNCKRKGHYARECRQPKHTPGKNWQPVPEKKLATMKVDHDALHWTGCYDDECRTHKSSKDDNGYYPQKKSMSMMKARTNHTKVGRALSTAHGNTRHPGPMELSATQSTQTQEEEDEYPDTEPFDDTDWDEIMRIRNNDPEKELEELLKIRNDDPERKYQPFPNGEDRYIRIKAVTPAKTYEHERVRPRGSFGDHELLNAQHDDHYMISWISCYDHTCEEHMGEKAKYGVFPIKPNQPVKEPYYEYETQGYHVDQFEEGVAILRFHGAEKCWDGGPLHECEDYQCQIHNQDKIEEWHKDRDNRKLAKLRYVEARKQMHREKNKKRRQRNDRVSFRQTMDNIIPCKECQFEIIQKYEEEPIWKMIDEGISKGEWKDDPVWNTKIQLLQTVYANCKHQNMTPFRDLTSNIYICKICHADAPHSIQEVLEELEEMEERGFDPFEHTGEQKDIDLWHQYLNYMGWCVHHPFNSTYIRKNKEPDPEEKNKKEITKDTCGTCIRKGKMKSKGRYDHYRAIDAIPVRTHSQAKN
jgi:hypothetical protein